MENSLNKTAFMTVSEYIEKITPTFKEFNKFIKKNIKYFKIANYNGVVYLTYPEFYERELASHLKNGYNSLANKEYIDRYWVANCERVTTEVPKEIYAKYLEYLSFFTEHFGEQALSKIENDELKSNKRSVRRAIDSNLYVDALKDEVITVEKLDDIFTSLSIRIPKHIIELKNKIVYQGYNRSVENRWLAQSKEFGDNLREALQSLESLKDGKRTNLMNIINNFETKFESCKLYEYKKSFKNKAFEEVVEQTINTFFNGQYEEGKSGNYIYVRKNNFDAILEEILNDYVEGFISTFVFRVNDKLKVVNNKLGIPTIEIKDACFCRGEFSGIVAITWSNGVKITINAHVIVAGGDVQVDHYRYLLKPFYKGKFIDLENIDNLNF